MAQHFVYSRKNLAIAHAGKTEFELLIEETWTKAMASGFFRYTLEDLESKILPGSHQFIVQLNRSRFQERRKPQPIQSLNEQFDPSKFNFSKVRDDEIMFRMEGEDLIALCLINVSPLENYHSLIVPKPNDLRNQILTFDAIKLALHCVLLSHDPFIRVAYNSLCAHASVNHLHLHIWYLRYELFVEKMAGRHLHGSCYEMTNHPVGSFVWEIENVDSVPSVSRQVSKVISLFLERDVAHNLFITRGRGLSRDNNNKVIRLLLWPRKSVRDIKCDNNYNIAVAELAGQVPVKNSETYESITENEIIQALSECRLSDELYNFLREEVTNILKKC